MGLLKNTGAVEAFRGVDGASLRFRAWRPEGRPARDVACVYTHGGTTHSAWFADIAHGLARRGITVYGMDRRGSGLNRDTPFHPGRFKDDIAIFLRNVRSTHAEVHLVGLCHGAIAFSHAWLTNELAIDSIVMINPLFAFKRKGRLWSAWQATRIASALALGRHVAADVEAKIFTRNVAFQGYCADDPMRLSRLPGSFFSDLLLMSRFVQKHARRMADVPLLVLVGGRNEMIDRSHVSRFLSAVPTARTKVYADDRHILFFDDPERFAEDLIAWLEDLGQPFSRGSRAA